MPYILNIHTATDTAIINLCSGKQILATSMNHNPKEHALFLHSAISELMEQTGIDVKKLDAIGVSSGPGSYTGIRVGLATAKGLCYALKIPLITFNSLEIMAFSSSAQTADREALYCPMIDARRMEVYTAIYDFNLQEMASPSAIILDENAFSDRLKYTRIFFSGEGSIKFKNLTANTNAIFIDVSISSESIATISLKKYETNLFENLPYAKPLYIKDFHTIFKK